MKNILQERKIDAFLKSGAMDKIDAIVEKAEETQTNFLAVSQRLSGIVSELTSYKALLDGALEDADLKEIERISSTIETLGEVLDEANVEDLVNELASIFKVKTAAKKVDKADIKKALGL